MNAINGMRDRLDGMNPSQIASMAYDDCQRDFAERVGADVESTWLPFDTQMDIEKQVARMGRATDTREQDYVRAYNLTLHHFEQEREAK